MQAWRSVVGIMGAGAAVLLLGAHTARAQECEEDTDCPKGFACTESAAVSCDAAAPACAPDDPDCKVPEQEAPDCQSEPFSWCTPLPCEDDSECEDGMVCWKEMRKSCSTSSGAAERPACAPGDDCAAPEPVPQDEPECTIETVAQCVPKYVPPCEESADCGEGFDCVELIAMSCSGSSGSAGAPTPSDPGDGDDGSSGDMAFAPPQDLPAQEPSCTSEPTGEFYCQLQEIACEADADCPSGFSCIDNPSIPVCDGGQPAPAEDAPAQGGAGGSSGSAGNAAPLPPEQNDCGVDESLPVKVCSPPFADLGGIGFDTGVRDGEAASGSDPQVDAPTMTNGGDDKGGDTAGGEEPPTDTDDDDANEHAAGSDDAAADSDEDSGCSVSSAGHSSSGLQTIAWLALGLAVMRARRRAR